MDDVFSACKHYHKLLEEKWKIVYGFQQESKPKVDNCAGVIGKISIWTLKPSLAGEKECGIDQNTFSCGCKHKFGYV